MDAPDPHAPTQYAGPERRQHVDGCDLAHKSYAMLVGDGRERGVFERLRSIETKIGVIGALLITPLWLIAVMAALDRWWQ